MKCKWKFITYSEHEYWETDCGETAMFCDATPIENGYKFCPYCGKELEQVTPENDK